MKSLFLFFSILLFASPAFSQIILSEIMYNPSGDENKNEFIELYNIGTTDIDLSGWTIADSISGDKIIDAGNSTFIKAGQFAVILDPAYFEDAALYEIPGSALILTIDGGTFGSRGLSNSSTETISLISSDGDTVAVHQYQSGLKNGFSLELLYPGSTIWQSATIANGTPGFRNSITPAEIDMAVTNITTDNKVYLLGEEVSVKITVRNSGYLSPGFGNLYLFDNPDISETEPAFSLPVNDFSSSSYLDSAAYVFAYLPDRTGEFLLNAMISFPSDTINVNNTLSINFTVLSAEKPRLIINEIMFDPLPQSSEWIELVNLSQSSVNLNGWQIFDLTNINSTPMIETDFILAPGNFAVITKELELFTAVYGYAVAAIDMSKFPSLNNSGDYLTLIDPAGRIIDEAIYEAPSSFKSGYSLEKIESSLDGKLLENWVMSTSANGATPGEKNAIGLPSQENDIKLTLSGNPFKPASGANFAELHCELPFITSLVELKIFDRYGRAVRSLIRGESRGSDFIERWDGASDRRSQVPTGIYIIYLKAVNKDGKKRELKTTIVVAR